MAIREPVEAEKLTIALEDVVYIMIGLRLRLVAQAWDISLQMSRHQSHKEQGRLGYRAELDVQTKGD